MCSGAVGGLVVKFLGETVEIFYSMLIGRGV